MWKDFVNELQMFFAGSIGIILRFAYMKREEGKISKLHTITYFVISYGMLFLLILYLGNKEILFGIELDDKTKMIFSAIGSVFSERVFTFLMKNETSIFKHLFKKHTGIEIDDKNKKDGID